MQKIDLEFSANSLHCHRIDILDVPVTLGAGERSCKKSDKKIREKPESKSAIKSM